MTLKRKKCLYNHYPELMFAQGEDRSKLDEHPWMK
jgi:hypothetical protein